MESNCFYPEDLPARSSAAAQLYLEHSLLLAKIATGRFGLSPDEAENAIQDVFLTFLRTPTVVRDPRAWLVAAICNYCRGHWRGRSVREPAAPEPFMHQLERTILSRQVMSRLPQSSQRVLTMHYIEGLTAAEIAGRLRTSLRYAEQLIHRGLHRARRAVSSYDAL